MSAVLTFANSYTRADGRVGVGFMIEFSGRQQHSVAWSDGPAQRFMPDELKEHHIAVEPLPLSGSGRAAETFTESEASELCPAVNVNVDPFPPAGGSAETENSETSSETESDGSQAETDKAEESPSENPGYFNPDATEAANIRSYLHAHPDATNQEVIAAMHSHGVEISSSQVTTQRKRMVAE